MSLIFATQLTAIATAVLAVFAIVTAWYARRAYRAQSGQLEDQRKLNEQQTPVLELQATELRESLEERKRQAERLLRAQASRVFITESKTGPLADGTGQWVTSPSVAATVQNSSDLPVYQVEIRWHHGPGEHGAPEALAVLLPGDTFERSRNFPIDADLASCGAYTRFTDAAVVRWVRRPDGYLGKQDWSTSRGT